MLARATSGTLDLWLTVPLVIGNEIVGVMGEDEEVVVETARPLGADERDAAEERARLALRRELWELRGGRSMGQTDERPIVLVTDGLDAAAPVIAAARALRPLGPSRIVLATPVGSRAALAAVYPHVDRVVYLERTIVGHSEGWFRDGSVPSERRARELLESVALEAPANAPLV
jgi:putative phosphoribosyl transferase